MLHEDGVYRHLRFQRPGTAVYGFDVVTWPGHLVICGDMGSFHFARTTDMFGFFAGPNVAAGINPYYWGEKLQHGASGGRSSVLEYSEEVVRARVREWRDQVCEDLDEHEARALRDAVDDQILSHGEALDHEYGARELLASFRHRHIDIQDSWEWDYTEFPFHYLWCCWAIVDGIRRYRKAQAPAEKAAA